jgi:hypothetical protein
MVAALGAEKLVENCDFFLRLGCPSFGRIFDFLKKMSHFCF